MASGGSRQADMWRAGPPRSCDAALRPRGRGHVGVAHAGRGRRKAPPRGGRATRQCGSMWAPVWGRHVASGFVHGGPTGIVGPGKNLGAVTQIRYRAPIFKHGEFQNFLRVGLCPTRSLPLQVTWTHDGRWILSERWRSRGPESTRSFKRDTCQSRSTSAQ